MRHPRLGHPLIDRQHRRILALGRELHRRAGAGRRCAGACGALIRATARHFASEERLMRRHGYPEAAGHIALHDGFLADLRRLRADLAGPATPHPKLIAVRLEWVLCHLHEADQNLVDFLRR